MFDELSNKLEEALKSLKGQDKITESNIEPALKKIRRALIDADVSLRVIDGFLKDIRSKAVGIEVVKGIRPEEKFVEIVHKELVDILGSDNEPLKESEISPTKIMLVGLQGAGKTTAAAKLALYLKRKGKTVLLVGADTFRPAAREQLKTLADQIGVSFYTSEQTNISREIVLKAITKGKEEGFDQVIIDTAGRLFIDDDMMNEIAELRKEIEPDETLLVIDSMIGQEAAELTDIFNKRIGISGGILTKLDGDARGGAALSIKKVSGKPIKFIGIGEKVDALEPFYPERLAGRILGMGDILTLVEKAQKEVEMNDVVNMQRKFAEATFDFTDFLQQMQLLKRLGSIGGLMKMIPGMSKIDDATLKTGEEQLKKIQSMISSMTVLEKTDPELLVKSQQRRKRIASGSGYGEAEVDKMINDFVRMRKMMQGMTMGKIPGIPSMANKEGNEYYKSKNDSLKKVQKKKKGFFNL